MNFRSLTLLITEDCNYDCAYCYHKKKRRSMSAETMRLATEYFLPKLTCSFHLCFYGGEPLLNFDLIRETVPFVRSLCRESGRRPHFSLTTNGSLCTEDVVCFLEKNRFSVTLSFDGLAQDAHRKSGSSVALRKLMKRFLEGGRVRLEVNSVFTPTTVALLYDSVRDLLEQGVPRVRYGLSVMKPWRDSDLDILRHELRKLSKFSAADYRKKKTIRIQNHLDEMPRRIRGCTAGADRLAIDTSGRIWGCSLFSDWARDHGGAEAVRRFSFGTIDRFSENADAIYPRIMRQYSRFSMDQCRTPSGPCFLCPSLGRCRVCPVVSALAGGGLGEIPSFVCEIQKVKAREAGRLARDLSLGSVV